MLLSVSLIVVSYRSCLTDLTGANSTGSAAVPANPPLRRWPAAIHPNFMQFSKTYFWVVVTQTHLVGADLIGKQNCAMLKELDTKADEENGKK